MSSFGEEIKRERELRRISLREIAEATKISLRYLEALEKNDFGDLPGGVFNRGFVRAYSECIGIDPETTVSAYLMEERAQLTARGGLPDSPRPRRPALRRRALAWVLVSVAAATAIGITAVWLWRSEPLAWPWANKRVGSAPTSAPAPRSIELSLRIERPTSGSVECDGRVDSLDGLAAGAQLAFHCTQQLVVDAADGGALHEVLPDGRSTPLGVDGAPLRLRRGSTAGRRQAATDETPR